MDDGWLIMGITLIDAGRCVVDEEGSWRECEGLEAF